MNGFAFAAIQSDDDDGTIHTSDGPGTSEVIDDEDEKEEELYQYTISGTGIIPFVPFSVTVTGNNQKAKGNGGNLQASIEYQVIDGGAWTNGQRVWSLGTRVCDSQRSNAQFSWLVRGKTPVTATLSYNAGHMVPAIGSSSVIVGKTFDFTIAFSATAGGSAIGSTCYARKFDVFGASYWWEAQKDGKWEKTTRIVVRSSSFKDAALSGTGYVGNLVGYDKIRLCVNYAGRDTVYAEATLTNAEVTITLDDDTLHCWGAATTLRIESDSLEFMTAAFYRGGDTTNDITDDDGQLFSFVFTGTSWEGDIQAAAGASEGTVVLKVMYNGVVQATKEIVIETEFLADISVSAGSILQGETFDMAGSVESTLGVLARIPANAFSLVAVQGNSQLISVSNMAGSQDVSYNDVTPTTTETVYVRIIDNRDGTIVTEAEVTVQSIKSALAAAINERVLAKTGTAGTASESDSASTLRSAAIEAIKNFVKGDIASDGTYDYYGDLNHGISTAVDTSAWYSETYGIVKSAVAKNVTPSVYETAKGKKSSGQVQTTVSGSGTNDDPYVLETEEHFKQRTVDICNAAQWDLTNGGVFENSSQNGAAKTMTYQAGWVSETGREYSNGYATATIQFQARRYSLTEYVSGTVDMYFLSGTKGNVYDTFGHKAPSSSGIKAKCGSFSVIANVQSFSPWFGTDAGTSMTATIDQMSNSRGYEIQFHRAFITYNFTHK